MHHTRLPLYALLFVLLVSLLGGCAAKDDYEFVMPAGGMVDQKNPRKQHASGLEGDSSHRQALQAAEAEALLNKLDADNRDLNNRLDAMLANKRIARSINAPAKGATSLGQERQEVKFNFLDADITEVIRLFMEYLGDNYVLHPGISGRVSFKAEDNLTRDELVDFLLGLLRIHGMAMFYSDEAWQIMPLSAAPAFTPPNGVILPQDGQRPSRGQFIQAYKLDYVAATEFTKIVQPFLSKGALVYGDDTRGVMVVCDYPHTLIKVQQLLNLFDVSVFADSYMQAYTLRYVSSEDASTELSALAESTGLNPAKGTPQVNFLSLDRLNMVLVVAKQQEVLEFIDLWVQELDKELPQLVTQGQAENVFVYYVQNGSAEEIVAALDAVFAKKDDKKSSKKKKSKDDKDTKTPGAPVPTVVQNTVEPNVGGIRGELTGDVIFVVDEATNSILTRANGQDYKAVLKVIEKLDIYPKQCLIEVIIAEVSLDQQTQLGIDWKYLLNGPGNSETTFDLFPTDAGSGVVGNMAISAVAGERLAASLNALANDDKTQILSAPHILASNHKEAKIDIGQEVPILTQTTETVDTTDSDNVSSVQQNIQYRNTGLLLAVTPHINERGLVRLELSQEISDVLSSSLGAIDSPVFTKRLAETTVVVNDAQTIVIGGLMEQQNDRNESNVPGVRRIPLLKYLFGSETKRFQNTELLIFITPHVVERQEDNDFISKNFLRRLQSIKRDML